MRRQGAKPDRERERELRPRMFDVVGGLVVNDLPSSGKCAAIPHSKHAKAY